MANWLDKYDTYKAKNGIEGTMSGLTDIPFNYNGAWGGTMQMGGSISVAVGAAAASKETPSYKKGEKVIKDEMGQWAHPGEITEINSPYITMKGVPYPVLGVSDTGDVQMMYPEQEYKFKGKKVREYPMAKNGINNLDAKPLTKLNQLTNFTNYNTKQPGGWMDKYQ